jgi:hypothetical protein
MAVALPIYPPFSEAIIDYWLVRQSLTQSVESGKIRGVRITEILLRKPCFPRRGRGGLLLWCFFYSASAVLNWVYRIYHSTCLRHQRLCHLVQCLWFHSTEIASHNATVIRL